MEIEGYYEIRRFEGRIWFKPNGDKPRVAVIAKDRQAMLDLLDAVKETKRVFEISLPCGGSKTFATHDDIPFEDLPCPCENPEHYLIQYQKGE